MQTEIRGADSADTGAERPATRPAGEQSRRPFSFVAAVRDAVESGYGNAWYQRASVTASQRFKADSVRDSERMRTMAGHRLAGHLRLANYVEHVLPVSTGHAQ